ncbi:MAG: glycosyltransferase [Cyclobacteriaceae bacterium]
MRASAMGKTSEKRILILTYWAYQDALIQTYTLPYVKIMAENPTLTLWLVCLQPADKPIGKNELETIQQSLAQMRIHLVLLRYIPWGLAGVFNTLRNVAALFFLMWRKRIDTIHAWATPAGGLGYLLARPFSRQLIIDSYEPHAEAMIENGTWQRGSLPFRILFWLEKKQTRYAHAVIAGSSGMREYAAIKYDRLFHEGFYVKPACVDLVLFDWTRKSEAWRTSLGLEGKRVGLYAGKFGGIYLDDDFFRWVTVAIRHWGDTFRLLLLTGHSDDEVQRFCAKHGIPEKFIIRKFVAHHEVPAYMAMADFAITPVKPVPSKRYCTPIKDGEYWAMGLPVIITKDISDDSDIIRQEQIGYVLQELNESEYLQSVKVIETLIGDPVIRAKIVQVANKYRSFEIARNVYRHVYPE